MAPYVSRIARFYLLGPDSAATTPVIVVPEDSAPRAIDLFPDTTRVPIRQAPIPLPTPEQR